MTQQQKNKMNILKIFFQLNSLFQVYSLKPQIQFTGEHSVFQFINQLCREAENKPKIILIDFRVTKYKTALSRKNCQFPYFLETNSANPFDNLRQFLSSPAFSQIKWQIIFDLSQNTQKEITTNLIKLVPIYAACISCRPFIIHLNLSLSQITQIINHIISQFPNNFQAIFVSKTTNTSAVHLRPILNGCDQQAGIFIPSSSRDFSQLKVPFEKCNLFRKRLNISVMNDFSRCSLGKDANGRLTVEYSTNSELFDIIREKYNFTAHYLDGGTWGTLVKGQWIGMVGQIARGQTNFAIYSIMETQARRTAVDFTVSTSVDDISFISQSPRAILETDLIVSNKISAFVWACSVGAFIAVTLLIKLNSKFWIEFHEKSEKLQISKRGIGLKMYAIIIRQTQHCITIEPSTGNRFLYGVWMLTSLILANAYSSIFYSSLTVPKYEQPIDSISDLLRVAADRTYSITVHNESALNTMIQNSSADNHLYHTIKENMHTQKAALLHTNIEVISRLEADKRLIVITLKNAAQIQRYLYARMQLHISTETLGSIGLAWPMAKRSPLKRPFDRIITRTHEMGFTRKWLEMTLRQQRHRLRLFRRSVTAFEGNQRHSAIGRTVKVLALPSLRSIFGTLLFGYACSAVYLGLEIVAHLSSKWAKLPLTK